MKTKDGTTTLTQTINVKLPDSNKYKARGNCLNLIGLFIVLIYISVAVAPIAGTYIAYDGNIQEMIIPPEVQNIVTDILGGTSSPYPNGSNEDVSDFNFAPPEIVSSSYDLAAKTVTVIFSFTNPLKTTLTINQVTAEAQCHTHGFLLGHASVPEAVEIPSGGTTQLTVVFAWTEAAQEHFVSSHLGETTLNVDLVNITLNVSGITIETPLTYNVDIPLT